MYFTFEEMSLEHLLPPVIRSLDTDSYYAPHRVFGNNLSLNPPHKPLMSYPDQRDEEFVFINSKDELICQFHTATDEQTAWQALFDSVDFSFIYDKSVLDFFVSMPELAGVDIQAPSFEIVGVLAHQIMDEFKKIREMNTNFDYVPPDPIDDCDGTEDLFYHAYALLNAGYHPSYYDAHTLRFQRVEDLEKQMSHKQDAFLPRDGSGYDDYGY